MISTQAPLILFLAVATVFVSGLATLTWGRRLPRKGDWLVGAGLIILIGAAVAAWTLFVEEGFQTKALFKGWVLPRTEPSALTVGILQDSLGLLMMTLILVVSGVLLLNGIFAENDPRSERSYAAIALSASGAVLSWISLTTWLSLVALSITVFAGFVALGSHWENDEEAALATKFAVERFWGILIALFGASLLAASHSAMIWGVAGVLDHGDSGDWQNRLGAFFLATGLLVQLQPFPLLGWLVASSKTQPAFKVSLTQVFPAWAALGVLLRLETQLRSVGLFPAFGWYAAASAVLAGVCALFQKEWRNALGGWLSCGFSISVAVLAFSGPWDALSLAIGTGLSGIAFALSSSALELGGPNGNTTRKKAIWAKAGCLGAAATSAGMAGFVGTGGGLRWLMSVWTQPALISVVLLVLFCFFVLAWKTAWNACRLKNATQASWVPLLSALFLLLPSLAVVWSGVVSTGVTFSPGVKLLDTPLAPLFGPVTQVLDEGVFNGALGLFFGTVVLAALTGFWTSGREQDSWRGIAGKMPRAAGFIASGYGTDRVFERGIEVLSALGRGAEWLVDRKIWGEWIPAGMAYGIQRGAGTITSWNGQFSAFAVNVMRKWIEVPSKLLQLIQNGDVRWYLFFALGSGIALLLHFLKF